MSRIKSTRKAAKKRKQGKGKTAARSSVESVPLPVPRELLAAGAPLDADVEVERQQRMEALKAALTRMVAEGRGAEAIDQVLVSMMSLERENERLAWRVLRANRFRFGRSSEKLSGKELAQLVLALGGEASETAAGAA
jgi:hypothetical protein